MEAISFNWFACGCVVSTFVVSNAERISSLVEPSVLIMLDVLPIHVQKMYCGRV